jgi:uncharacterized membrane protein YczE
MSARLVGRLVQLYAGLVAFGVSLALMLRADLGLGPWDVLHQGVAERLGVPIGWVVIGTGIVVMLAWIPLRERPGIGTLSNAVLVGLVADAALALISAPAGLAVRIVFLAVGIVGTAIGTGLYVGAGFGPGPRDGLMTGLARRGLSVRVVRTGIELTALTVGVLLGGSVGIGTIAFALGIGPLVQLALRRLSFGNGRTA